MVNAIPYVVFNPTSQSSVELAARSRKQALAVSIAFCKHALPHESMHIVEDHRVIFLLTPGMVEFL